MKKKIAAIAVGVLALVGCYGQATGHNYGTSYVGTYSKQFQNDVGYPLIFITYMCSGHTAEGWKNTQPVNVNEYSQEDISISAYCPSGFAQAFPNDAHG